MFSKRGKNTRMIAVCAAAAVLIAGLVACSAGTKESPLVGTWVYDQYTRYVFENDGSGCLLADDVRYDYTYKTAGDRLTMDFTENVVRDCEYSFLIDGDELTLIGGENTDGGTYKLKKAAKPEESGDPS